jgi:hypothetical protein
MGARNLERALQRSHESRRQALEGVAAADDRRQSPYDETRCAGVQIRASGEHLACQQAHDPSHQPPPAYLSILLLQKTIAIRPLAAQTSPSSNARPHRHRHGHGLERGEWKRVPAHPVR